MVVQLYPHPLKVFLADDGLDPLPKNLGFCVMVGGPECTEFLLEAAEVGVTRRR
jgi:hypothetical protein